MKNKLILPLLILLLTSCVIHRPRPELLQKIAIDYPDRFSKSDLNEMRKFGCTYQSASELAEMENSSGEYLFSGTNISRLIFHNVKMKKIRRFIKIREDELNFSGTEITRIITKEKSYRKLKKTLKLKRNGEYIFSEKSFSEYITAGYSYKHIRPLLKYSNRLKLKLSVYHIMRILNRNINDIKSFSKMDNFAFNEEEFVRYLEAGGSFEYAERLFGEGFSGRSIYRFRQLGLSANEVIRFADTDKPDAVIVFSEYDYNDEFETQASIRLFREISEEYDCFVRIVSSEMEIYSILNEFRNIDLLWIAGHGIRSGIILSSEAEKIESPEYEKYMLDTGDKELNDINIFSSISSVFLDACETGKGESPTVNFAGFIKKILPEAKIIYSDRIFSHDELILESAYPLNIKFIEKSNQSIPVVP